MFSQLVNLTAEEISIGAQVGLQRQLRCQRGSGGGSRILSEYTRRYGSPGANGLWHNSIEGSLGEFAVAKFLNLYPTGIGGYDFADVSDNIEVRTRPEKFHQLFLKKKDKPGNYVLVQGSYGEYVLRGWISASEVFSHDEWFHSNNGKTTESYWVPHESLYSISTLSR